MVRQQSHGNGRWVPGDFRRLGEGTHLEATVLVLHAGNVEIGAGLRCDRPDYAVAAGVPARLLHKRG